MHRDRSWAVMVFTAMAVLVAITVIGLPLIWIGQLQQAQTSNASLLDTLGRANQSGPNAAGTTRSEDPLISGDSAGRAGALLQLKLDELAAANGVTIRSVQVLTPKRDGELTRIMVAVTLQSVTASLRNFLHMLETTYPLIVVDEFSIRALPAPQQDVKRAMPLEVSLVVRGLALLKDVP